MTLNDNKADISKPDHARRFIAETTFSGNHASYITTSEGRIIHLRNMSDDDAVWVARQFKNMLDERARRKQ